MLLERRPKTTVLLMKTIGCYCFVCSVAVTTMGGGWLYPNNNNNNIVSLVEGKTLLSSGSHSSWYHRMHSMRGGAVSPSPEHRFVVSSRTSSVSKENEEKQDLMEASTATMMAPPPTTLTPTVTATVTATEISSSTSTTPTTTTAAIAKTSDNSMSIEEKKDVVASKDCEGKEKNEDPRILVLIRVLFLSYYASLGSLMPYLPVYYHSLGHGGQIIGLIGAVKPLTTFLVAPFWGIVSDKSNDPFKILKMTFIVSFVGQLLVASSHDYSYIMAMVFLTALFNAPVKSLLDSMVMDHLQDQSQYGKLRLWGQMGFGIGSSGVGVLLSKSQGKATPGSTSIPTNWLPTINGEAFPSLLRWMIHSLDQFWQSLYGYKLLFTSYAALSIPTWFAIQYFQKLDKEQQQQNQLKQQQQNKQTNVVEGKQQKQGTALSSSGKTTKEDEDNNKVVTTTTSSTSTTSTGSSVENGLWLLLHNSDALLFFFLVFVVGISSGCIENFAYVRIREVGGSGKEMGLSRLVSSIAGAPMFWFSGPLTQALGADRVLVLSLLSYVTRFIIYAYMRHPLHGLPAEALRGITFAGFWSTATIYAHKISPPGLHATILMFLNAMYGGLGQSLGAIIGGKLQGKLGTVKTFLYAAIADFSFVCGLVTYLSLRKDSNFKNPTPIDVVPKAKKKVQQQEQQQQQRQQQHPSSAPIMTQPAAATTTDSTKMQKENDDRQGQGHYHRGHHRQQHQHQHQHQHHQPHQQQGQIHMQVQQQQQQGQKTPVA